MSLKASAFVKSLLAGVSGLLVCAAAASAAEVKIADGLPKNGGLTTGFEAFTKALGEQTEGRHKGRFFPGSLFGYAEIGPGIKDGLVDIGYIPLGYFRAEYPVNNLISDVSTATMDPVVAAGAMSEFVFACKPCMDEFKAQNQLPLGFSAIGPYYMYSRPRIETLADIQGKRIRGFGAFGRWVDTMGGSAATLSANEVYAAVSQGVIAGNTHTLNTIKTLSMGEVTDYLLNVPIAMGIGNSLFTINRGLWNELSEADKRGFLAAAAIGHASATTTYYKDELEILNNPVPHGVELVEPAEDLRQKSEQFHKDDIETVIGIHKGFGVADPEKHVAQFLETVKRWEGLVAAIDSTDAAAVTDLLNREIYTKVDLTIFD